MIDGIKLGYQSQNIGDPWKNQGIWSLWDIYPIPCELCLLVGVPMGNLCQA